MVFLEVDFFLDLRVSVLVSDQREGFSGNVLNWIVRESSIWTLTYTLEDMLGVFMKES